MIAFEHVSKRFGDPAGQQITALDRVSLEIARGEFLAIVGGSGSGKTTLMRLANRLIAPDRGTVRVDGADIAASDPIALRRGIGTVFQSGALFPHLSVAANVGVTLRLLRRPETEIAARIDEMLDLVRLEPSRYRARLPHELSGGQRQRVGVARALAARPQILLMDEPFGALDPLTRDALGEDIAKLHRSLKLTTLMVTHDIAEAMLLADRIAVMREGHLVGRGTARELARLNDPHVNDLLRTPRRQAERLRALLPEIAEP